MRDQLRVGDGRYDDMAYDEASEPVINVSVDQGQVVLRPVGVLDDEAIDTLLRLLAGARAAGATAVVDLELVEREPTAV